MTTEAQLREALESIEHKTNALAQMAADDFPDAHTVITMCQQIDEQAKAALSLPSQRPADEGVDFADDAQFINAVEAAGLGICEQENRHSTPDGAAIIFQQNKDRYVRQAKAAYFAIRPYLRAKPGAGLVEIINAATDLERMRCYANEYPEGSPKEEKAANTERQRLQKIIDDAIARQHTCAGAGKGVVERCDDTGLNRGAGIEGSLHLARNALTSKQYPSTTDAIFHIDDAIAALAQGKVSA